MKPCITLSLTYEELAELFNRCLSSSLEDTETSLAAMQKLAEAMKDGRPNLRIAA